MNDNKQKIKKVPAFLSWPYYASVPCPSCCRIHLHGYHHPGQRLSHCLDVPRVEYELVLQTKPLPSIYRYIENQVCKAQKQYIAGKLDPEDFGNIMFEIRCNIGILNTGYLIGPEAKIETHAFSKSIKKRGESNGR